VSFTPKQRAIAVRLDDVSRRLREKTDAQQQVPLTVGSSMDDAVAALTAALDQTNEIMPLFREHGETFRELLNAIVEGS
jgi:hypothetical protein